jgi:hypothetical protein
MSKNRGTRFLLASWACLLGNIEISYLSLPVAADNLSAQETIVNKESFQLINQGTYPREVLRFSPVVNSQEQLQMTVNTLTSMDVDGQVVQKLDIPLTQFLIGFQVERIDEKGDIYLSFGYDRVEVKTLPDSPSETVNAFRQQMQQLVGFKGNLAIDNRGNTKQASWNFPEQIDPTTKNILEQTLTSLKDISFPVPEEPVGVGAEWSVVHPLNINGIQLLQTATYKILSLKDEGVTLAVKIQQKANPQKLNIAGLSPDSTLNLISLDGIGNGEVILNLKKIIPLSSTMSMKSQINTKLKEGNSSKETTINTNTLMEIKLQSQ